MFALPETRKNLRYFSSRTQPAPSIPKTFDLQHTLPRLPIPPLEASLSKYIRSLKPIIDEVEGEGKTSEEGLKKRREIAADFIKKGGLGTKLQERLVDLERSTPHDESFLSDLWLKAAYHSWREPLIINSNWWLLFHPDATVPKEITDGSGEAEGSLQWQIRRAAWLTNRFLEFKQMMEDGSLPPDETRTNALDMSQYSRLFYITRIPQAGCDTLTTPPEALTGPMTLEDSFNQVHRFRDSLMVMYKDFIYTVDVAAGDLTGLEGRLKEIVEDVKQREKAGDKPWKVGVMTADHRDEWTKNREYLLGISPQNRNILNKIESSIFTLSLDAHTLPSVPSLDSPLVTKPEVDAHALNCSSGGGTGHNRWFDKALNVFVESNTRGGINCEHSPCDALIPSIVIDYAIGNSIDESKFQSPVGSSSATSEGLVGWERLDFIGDDELAQRIEEAEKRAKAIIEDSDASVLWFDKFGTDWIKSVAKCSPDAFIQMVLQTAWNKVQGFQTATYETASTRMFKYGRTDVIRTVSEDSRAFVQTMSSSSASAAEKYKKLTQACRSHTDYTRDASSGKGCDRHLMVLKSLMQPGESHALFDDPMYSKSQEWKLSTSGLSAGDRFHGTGFGTVWPDGYGINYLPGKYLIKFGIESKKSCPTTSTLKFKEAIVETFDELKRICEEQAKPDPKL